MEESLSNGIRQNKRRYMIEIFEPRYHDRRVLIAQFRIPAGKDFLIRITKGACAGMYKVTSEIVKNSPVESEDRPSARPVPAADRRSVCL